MSAVGHCADNAACEGFFGMLKRERANHRQYRTLDAVDTIQSLAAGDLSEEQLAEWKADHTASVAKTLRAAATKESP